jgi:hypothetical protein
MWVSGAARPDAVNLIPNGDFERASAADPNLPEGWTPHENGKVKTVWVATGAVSGKRCLEMVSDPEERGGHAYWVSQPFAVRPGMAHRMSLRYKAEGHGVPIFDLEKVKNWRLKAGGTEGKWVLHEDVVVVPPDVTTARFFAHNYHRRGKTIWVDDIRLYELPLSESPMTKRLIKARESVGALERNLARLQLTAAQQDDLAAMRVGLTDLGRVYAKLEAGEATGDDFRQMNEGLDAIEKTIGGYLFTVWAIAPEQWERGAREPTIVTRSQEMSLRVARRTTVRHILGVMGLVGEGLAARVTVVPQGAARKWEHRLLVTPASARGGGAWGAMNALGEVFLPPGVPRFVTVEIEPGDAKPGEYAVKLPVECLDRPAEAGQVAMVIQVVAIVGLSHEPEGD